MALPSPGIAFFGVGAVILLGAATLWLFEKTRFPDVLVLMAIGLVLGPLNSAAVTLGQGSEWLQGAVGVETLRQIAPFVSNLALILILFDAGLKLDFAQFARSVRAAALHTIPIFVLGVAATATLAHWVLGMPPLVAVVLGVALSNVGQTVSGSVIREMRIDPEVKALYFVEMALYDLLSIPIIVALLQFADTGAADAGLFFGDLARIVSVSVLLGAAMGIAWVFSMIRLGRYQYSYMLTFASILLLYSLNVALEGSGVVSVLIFGLVVGNRRFVLRMAHQKDVLEEEGDKLHAFHNEITFFVRAFFFVFLGLTFSTGPGRDGWLLESRFQVLAFLDHTPFLFLLAVVLVFAAIVAVRYLVVKFIAARQDPKRLALKLVYGRGLGTAVLATFPFTVDAYRRTDSAYHALFQPWEPLFTNFALLIVLFTVLGTSIGVWNHERRIPANKKDAAAASGESSR